MSAVQNNMHSHLVDREDVAFRDGVEVHERLERSGDDRAAPRHPYLPGDVGVVLECEVALVQCNAALHAVLVELLARRHEQHHSTLVAFALPNSVQIAKTAERKGVVAEEAEESERRFAYKGVREGVSVGGSARE